MTKHQAYRKLLPYVTVIVGIILCGLFTLFAYSTVNHSRSNTTKNQPKHVAESTASDPSPAPAEATPTIDAQALTDMVATNPATPAPQPSLTLRKSYLQSVAVFTAQDDTTANYLVVFHHLDVAGDDIVTSQGLSMAPPSNPTYHLGTVEFWRVQSDLIDGDARNYTFYVCENINGACGLTSNTLQLKIDFGSVTPGGPRQFIYIVS